MSSGNIPVKADPADHATDEFVNSSKASFEVTGLGLITCLIIAFWPLASDGTMPLSGYLALVALLLVAAGVLLWRILKTGTVQQSRSRGDIEE